MTPFDPRDVESQHAETAREETTNRPPPPADPPEPVAPQGTGETQILRLTVEGRDKPAYFRSDVSPDVVETYLSDQNISAETPKVFEKIPLSQVPEKDRGMQRDVSDVPRRRRGVRQVSSISSFSFGVVPGSDEEDE